MRCIGALGGLSALIIAAGTSQSTCLSLLGPFSRETDALICCRSLWLSSVQLRATRTDTMDDNWGGTTVNLKLQSSAQRLKYRPALFMGDNILQEEKGFVWFLKLTEDEQLQEPSVIALKWCASWDINNTSVHLGPWMQHCKPRGQRLQYRNRM